MAAEKAGVGSRDGRSGNKVASCRRGCCQYLQISNFSHKVSECVAAAATVSWKATFYTKYSSRKQNVGFIEDISMGSSGPQILVGYPLGVLTSSFMPLAIRPCDPPGRVTHAPLIHLTSKRIKRVRI